MNKKLENHKKIFELEAMEVKNANEDNEKVLLTKLESQEDIEFNEKIFKNHKMAYQDKNSLSESYMITSLIQKGGFTQVYEAIDESNKKELALKVYSRGNETLRTLKAAKREVKIMRRLNGEFSCDANIVNMIDYFLYKGCGCLVFEKLSISILEMLEVIGYNGFPFQDISTVTKQIISALTFAYKLGIIHSDLRPENILFKKQNCMEVKVIDWALAKDLNDEPNYIFRNRFYRAPELHLNYSFCDLAAIDIWALGCIIAELYIGLPVFPGSSDYDQLSKIFTLLGYKFVHYRMPDQQFLTKCTSTEFLKVDTIVSLKTREEYEKVLIFSFQDKAESIPEPRIFYELNEFEDFEELYDISDFRDSEDFSKMPLFLEILEQTLRIDPLERISLYDLQSLPFITEFHQEISSTPGNKVPILKWKKREELETKLCSKESSKEIFEQNIPL